MRASRTSTLIVMASLGIAACGDDDDSDQAAAPKTTTQTETTTEAPKKAPIAGLAAPGEKLAIGETATVGWQPPSVASKSLSKVVKVDMTVLSLKKGAEADLKGIQLGEDQRGKTPYYAQIRMRNTGGETPSDFEEPNLGFAIVDDTNKETGRVLLRDFAPCKEVEAPKPFTEGKSFETCYVFFAQGSVKEVQWRQGPNPPTYLSDPVIWEP